MVNNCMIKKLATSITQYSIMHNWIEHSQYAWCRYALEKELGKIPFSIICLVLMKFTNTWVAISSFVLVFCIFRSRMGGWHARHIWSCQLISVTLVVFVTFILGPFIECMQHSMIFALDIAIIGVTLFLSPVYPSEAHFSQEVKALNNSRKNVMLLVLLIFQGVDMVIAGPSFLIYSLVALLITDISVLLQYLKLKKEG